MTTLSLTNAAIPSTLHLSCISRSISPCGKSQDEGMTHWILVT